jgi:hypothetical protein
MRWGEFKPRHYQTSGSGVLAHATAPLPKPAHPLTNPRSPRYHLTSLLYGADLGFHAEWLRDEPYEATTTGSEFIFWSPGVNSRPTQGEHEIRGAEFPASRSSFPHSTGKEDFAFRALFKTARPAATPKRVAHDLGSTDIRITLSRMRQELGKPAPFHLRRLFLSPRSFLRLRSRAPHVHP